MKSSEKLVYLPLAHMSETLTFTSRSLISFLYVGAISQKGQCFALYRQFFGYKEQFSEKKRKRLIGDSSCIISRQTALLIDGLGATRTLSPQPPKNVSCSESTTLALSD